MVNGGGGDANRTPHERQPIYDRADRGHGGCGHRLEADERAVIDDLGSGADQLNDRRERQNDSLDDPVGDQERRAYRENGPQDDRLQADGGRLQHGRKPDQKPVAKRHQPLVCYSHDPQGGGDPKNGAVYDI